MLYLLFVLVLFVFAAVFIVGIYNSLIARKNQVKNAFAQIDVQLKRRYDLIPNLVEATKAYLKHERETLEAVIKFRNEAYAARATAAENPSNATAMKGLMGAEQVLTQGLSKLMAVMESYPDLKANSSVNQLKEELTSTENRVSFSRQAFNDAVMAYNTSREVFPSNILAGMFQFQAAQAFEITDVKEREAPKVSFG